MLNVFISEQRSRYTVKIGATSEIPFRSRLGKVRRVYNTISLRNVHGNRGKFLEVIFLEVTRFKHVRPHTIAHMYVFTAAHIDSPRERLYNNQYQQHHSWMTTNRNLILQIELIANSPGFSII